MNASPEYIEAGAQQARAAYPSESHMVSANAGSGKTKVLVDRVCRILCQGSETGQPADPGRILCLTYTKAAASEMQTRLFDKLGRWSVMPRDKLNDELNNLFGSKQNRTTKQISDARELFARALETPEGLKIQTIHAFCERVLARFPLEAGITPGFEALDEADAVELQAEVRREILIQANNNRDSELAWAVSRLAREHANRDFDGILKNIAGKGDAVLRWRATGGLSELASALNLPETMTMSTVQADAWQSGPLDEIRQAAQLAIRDGSQTDIKNARKILSCFEMPPDKAFQTYRSVILKQDFQRRSYIFSKNGDTARFFGHKAISPTPEADRVFQAQQTVFSAQCMELTRAVFILAQAWFDRYSFAKRRLRKLDFGDQISMVRDLLSRSEAADWIRFKLDYGIEHILVDEAQDTAPDQWTIIDALRAGFVEPDPALISDDLIKTFFAVGDEKQSIYSFQGARPEQFRRRVEEHYQDDPGSDIRMQMSFRSSQEVLDVVDNVFSGETGLARLFGEDDTHTAIRHHAFRTLPGQVELWPLAPPPDDAPDNEPWDTKPVDAVGQTSSREKLAAQIAAQVRIWLDRGEPVNDRDDNDREYVRPVQPGDVLILVRKRQAFFDAVIRNLKQHHVPVAGADRLVLRDAVVVKDMLALTRFVLLPADDLSLAEVMRSPLLNLTENQLFQIAHDRGEKNLWQALAEKDEQIFKQTTETLKTFRRYAARFAPYEFYARVLDHLNHQGHSVKAGILRRLGREAEDALDAFLAQALAHQRSRSPSLQHFLQEFENSDQDIKREMDRADGEVRVMTVHGAKGLEAPIVILPDTTGNPGPRSVDRILPFENGFAYRHNNAPTLIEDLKEKAAAEAKQESMRLFYVAMTRAESRLVICGFHSGAKTGTGYEKGSWYEAALGAMTDLPTTNRPGPFGEVTAFGNIGTVSEIPNTTQAAHTQLPDWIADPAPNENQGRRNLTPSDLLGDMLGADMPLRSPAAQTADRFQRGNIIHKLLEILPDIDPDRRRAAAQAYLGKHQKLSSVRRQQIEDEVMAVLENPEFSKIFAPGSKAEVSLTGSVAALPHDISLNAQIDRLAIHQNEVFIVDFKSNRPPPVSVEDVPEIYWGQMAAYRAMIANVYPEHQVRCALLWTDGPRLMWLDEEHLDATLTKIGGLLT